LLSRAHPSPPLSLHDALPIFDPVALRAATARGAATAPMPPDNTTAPAPAPARLRRARLLYRDGAGVSSTLVTVVSLRDRQAAILDRKSTRLNSSHQITSYAHF